MLDTASGLGLVDCLRGGRRVASKYALTWLPLHNGTAATNQWRTFQNPKLKPLPTAKIRNLPAKQQAELPAKQQADGANLPAKQQAHRLKTLPAKQQSYLDILTRAGMITLIYQSRPRPPV